MRTFKTLLLALPLLLLAACSDDNGVDPPVDNTDTEKPFLTIIRPTADQEVSGDALSVEINATDNHKVVKVELYLSNSPFVAKTLTAEPWTTTLDISALGPGVHAVSAKAFDSTGNESNRSTVSFVKVEEDTDFTFSFQEGAEFVYDRWDLDANNDVDEGSKRVYTTRISKGTGTMGGETDWYRMISTDNVSGRVDTLIVRTDAQHNILVYGLPNTLLRRILRSLIDAGQLPGMPELPEPTWQFLAQVNDTNGDALEPGVQWDLTSGNGIEIPLGLFTARVRMNATYAEKGEVLIAGAEDIFTWRTRILVTVDLLGQTEVPVDIWFSDAPSAQIQLRQESATVGIFTLEGDLQKLSSWN